MSITAWSVLGLEETTDAKVIRKAYASKIKVHRPDEDPVHFALLTDAYGWAMQWARQQSMQPQLDNSASDADPPLSAASRCPPSSNALAPEMPESAPLDTVTPGAGESGQNGAAPAQDEGFHFAPFFEEMSGRIRERDSKCLAEWLEQHPDLYSIELKWALIPHIYDALARNAAALQPNRGHLDVLSVFLGIDAGLRRHPSIAPAIDYLESGAWRAATSTILAGTAMPSGWENLPEIMAPVKDRRAKERNSQRASGGSSPWLVVVLIFAAMKLGALWFGNFTSQNQPMNTPWHTVAAPSVDVAELRNRYYRSTSSHNPILDCFTSNPAKTGAPQTNAEGSGNPSTRTRGSDAVAPGPDTRKLPSECIPYLPAQYAKPH